MKQVILCADDYGQNIAISQGILSLIEQQRLSATSCMVTTRDWPEAARALQPYAGRIDIGLHFNLTEGDGSTPHGALMCQAFLRQLTQADIEQHLRCQLKLFAAHFGRTPDFIDGHQHIQQLPVIRDAIINVYQNEFLDKKPYIRVAMIKNIPDIMRKPCVIKQLIIHATGASKLKLKLCDLQIPHNTYFSGIYDFSSVANYGKLFAQFLPKSAEKTIIMCHPGETSLDGLDPIRDSRPLELAYLSGKQFSQDLQKAQIKLCRYQELI